MFEYDEIENAEAEFPEKALIAEQLLIDETEVYAREIRLKMTSSPNGSY